MTATTNRSSRHFIASATLAVVFAVGVASIGCAATPADDPGPKTAKWYVLDDDGVPITRTDGQRADAAEAHQSTTERADEELRPAHATSGYYGSPLDIIRGVGEIIRFVSDLIRILGCLR